MNAPAGELGASWLGDGRCRFVVWAPARRAVHVVIKGASERSEPLGRAGAGYFTGVVEGVAPGDAYVFRLDNDLERPDPASRSQPDGVHGPSRVVDPAFAWSAPVWRTPSLRNLVLQEVHIGAFTRAGTFDGAVERLDYLVDLGVTGVSVMPVAQCPGARNWGYDGVYPYAVQRSYGGPEAFKRFVDACHARSMAVILDVVYNHIGPEGNYLRDFGPYFTSRYKTPWGEALNFDGPGSDEVRRYFIDNALRWVTEFRVDGLRLDAVHAIIDATARPFLEELTDRVHDRAAELDRRVLVNPESADNDARLLRARAAGGLGMDAQWSDDFHHALHTLLTGERNGYYADFGSVADLAAAMERGFVHEGNHSVYRGRRHGRPARDIPGERFIVSAQTHDQVGNRAHGERLSALVSFERQKLAAGALLLSPFVPMLFMGEEYGETAPFLYFVDHSDPTLIDAVRRGRKDEFAAFGWSVEPPDPQSPETFERSRLRPELMESPRHRCLHELHKTLIALRRSHPALLRLDKARLRAVPDEANRTLLTLRSAPDGRDAAIVCFFADRTTAAPLLLPVGRWRSLIDSGAEAWLGEGRIAPESVESGGEIEVSAASPGFALLEREER